MKKNRLSIKIKCSTSEIILLLGLLYLIPAYSFSQSMDSPQSNRADLLIEIASKIKSNYIFPDIAFTTDSMLKSEIATDKFKNLTDEEFATKLTIYLRAISKDKHFFVKYLNDKYHEADKVNEKEQQRLDNISNSLENFGFEEVKRLEGNIGYINYKGFADSKASETALVSAMNFVSNTNSLIIDLRDNRGGDGEMARLFCNYFFKDRTKLYSLYYRNKTKTIEAWANKKVKGAKYLNKQIFILTSNSTFSAAESLCYFLQVYGIAKIVGEQTGGAANPVDHFIIDNKYLLLIPNGKVTVNLTQNNWDQVGITPNERTSKANALTKAHIMALHELLNNGIKTELSKTEIQELIHKLESEL